MSLRRRAGVAAVLVLTAGAAWHPVPAHALVTSVQAELYETATVADATCAKPTFTGPRPGTVALPADGRTREYRLDRTGGTPAVALHAAGTVRGWAARNSWGTHRVVVSALAAVSSRPRSGGACALSLRTEAALFARVAGVRKSWLVVTSSGSSRGGAASPPIVGLQGDTVQALVAPGRSLTRLVPAGDYLIGARVTPRATAAAHSTTVQGASASVSATVSLLPVGTLRAQSGGGLAYVTAGHRSCASNSTYAYFSSAARTKAQRITFYVDGQRRGVLTGSALQRSALPVTGIAPRGIGEVRAVIRLKSGDKRTMRAISWPCA